MVARCGESAYSGSLSTDTVLWSMMRGFAPLQSLPTALVRAALFEEQHIDGERLRPMRELFVNSVVGAARAVAAKPSTRVLRSFTVMLFGVTGYLLYVSLA